MREYLEHPKIEQDSDQGKPSGCFFFQLKPPNNLLTVPILEASACQNFSGPGGRPQPDIAIELSINYKG